MMTLGCRCGHGSVQGDVVERRVGVLAQDRDCPEADHDDQGQHDGVFNRRRTVFPLDEPDDGFVKLTHDESPCCFLRSGPTLNGGVSRPSWSSYLGSGGADWRSETLGIRHPFGSLAIPEGPMALRHRLATVLPFRGS